MSNRTAQVLLGTAALGVGAYYYNGRRTKTTGTKNIEDRFTAGGGAPSHTPGAATERGNAHNTESKQTAQGASKKPFSEGIQYDKEKHDDPHQNTGKFYDQVLQDKEKKS